AKLARSKGAALAVDATFATPILFRPASLGATMVIHSLTKYVNGHGDVMGGVVAGSEELRRAMRDRTILDGAYLPPHEAWLTIRGLRTLALRVRRQCESALAIARHLVEHAKVARVRYPGLPDHPQHDLATRQFGGLFGAVVSFVLREESRDAAFRFLDGLEMARSLAAHGLDVIALDPDPRGLGQASRAVSERHKCPNPLEDEHGFVQYMLDNARHFGEGAVLFPTNDEWVLAVARYRSQLETCYRIPFSELSVIDAVLDKRRLYADAHHLGIPIPRTYSLSDPKSVAKQIRYPAIVKPAEQRRFYDRFGVKVFRADNAKELTRFAEQAADLACVAQEIVDVPAGGFYSFCSYVAPDGEIRGAFVG